MHKKNPINQTFKWIFIFTCIIAFAVAGEQYYINNIIHADAVPTSFKQKQPQQVKMINAKLMEIKKRGKLF